MNRSDRHQCLFFHVPRTGGSSVESLDWWNEWTGHFPSAREVKPWRARPNPDIDKYFSFAFVRNPWDRFVSLYHYFAAMTPGHRWYKANSQMATGVRRCGGFLDFCRTFQVWPYRDNFHFWPQCRWIADANGTVLVDFVGRFERLHDDLAEVCARLGLPATSLPQRNASTHKPYLVYYDDETRDIVASLFRRDATVFRYAFAP